MIVMIQILVVLLLYPDLKEGGGGGAKFKRNKFDYVNSIPNLQIDELSGTPSSPRNIVAGTEARRQKCYGQQDDFNYASSIINELPEPRSNIAGTEARRQKCYGQQDDSPTINNASLISELPDIEEEYMDDTNPFNSFQPNSWPIRKTSFVGYRRRINYTNEYFIAQVENIVDFSTQYELKLLQRVKYHNYRIYYTWDPEQSDEFSTRMNLVLLKSPMYSYETRGIAKDDNLKVHKYLFPTKIEDDIKSYFDELTLFN